MSEVGTQRIGVRVLGMRVSGKWIAAIGACTMILGRAEVAEACGALPCADVQDVQPADTSSGVALDAEIRVRYFGGLDARSVSECGDNLARIRLWPDGAEAPIELEGELLTLRHADHWLVVKPPEPLLPNTAYRLELNVGLGGFACSCEGKWTSFSSFTTGADVDAGDPELGNVSALGFGERQTGNSDCGTQDLIPVLPDLDTANDDSPGVRYNVYVDGVLASPFVENVIANEEGSPEIYLNCGTSALINATLVEPGSLIEIRAVDLAGNESPPTSPVRVPDRCNASSDVDSSGGCSLSAVRGRTGAAWLFAVLAGFAAHEARASKRRSLARKTSSPGDSASARSMTLRSSRTLPGQS
jgi:hypothetical protein